jgi:RNA polymerase sigma-70 factor, ECF subfamily
MQRTARHMTCEVAPSPGFRPRRPPKDTDHDPAIARAIAAAQAGEKDAIRFLYIRYKDPVYGYVLSILHDEYEAEDITQLVFLKLMFVITKYKQGDVPFTSWLLRVSRNAALDQLRRRRVVPSSIVYEPGRPDEDAGRDRRSALLQAMQVLPEDQRRVLAMTHLVGMAPREIASRLGRTESSIHALHHRARQTMKRELTAAECGPATVPAA